MSLALEHDAVDGGAAPHVTAMRGWFVSRDAASLTLSRQLPVRFDASVEAVFPKMGKLRLATQIRQDMWRALQKTRGFSPAVQVTDHGEGLIVRAGGRLNGRAPHARVMAIIADVLNNPGNRARWGRFAGEKQ